MEFKYDFFYSFFYYLFQINVSVLFLKHGIMHIHIEILFQKATKLKMSSTDGDEMYGSLRLGQQSTNLGEFLTLLFV